MAIDTHPVNVLVTLEMAEPALERIRQVSPRLALTYLPYSKLGADTDRAREELARAEVLYAFKLDFELDGAPRLRWVQTPGAGVDYFRALPIMRSDIVITNAHLFGAAIAEYVFLSILSFRRRFPQILADYYERREWPQNPWDSHRGQEIGGTTLGILGYGEIGRAVARAGRGFGMRVLATRANTRDPYQEDGIEVLPSDRLMDVLAESDQVVIALPLTAATEKLIGERELRAMKPNAYLVNVGRGKVIDEPGLIRALKEGWIAGAGLDVQATRPLPADSPLFDMPNVILTPHISGISNGYEERIIDLFCENLSRYLDGRPLLNVVDKARGY